MDFITSFFLRAKHWQIFLLLVGFGIVGDIAILSSISAPARSPQGSADIGFPFEAFGIVMVLWMFCFLAWFWSMGSFLGSLVPAALRLRMGFFRFALIYPALYVPVFITIFQSTKPALLAIILPLHLFAMFCIFYALYFVSKSLVLAETGKSVSFYDYAGPFFLIWFFPIGVWFTQPRINRLYERRMLPPMAVEPEALSPLAVAPPSTPGSCAQGIPAEAPAVYAGFWLRLAAALIDALAMFIPVSIMAFVMVFILQLASTSKGYAPMIVVLAACPLVMIVVTSFYFALLESSTRQATLGKKAVGLYVSDVEGRRLTLSRAMGRTLAKYLSIMTAGIGYIMCGFTKKKQALHDMIAGCLVLRRP